MECHWERVFSINELQNTCILRDYRIMILCELVFVYTWNADGLPSTRAF